MYTTPGGCASGRAAAAARPSSTHACGVITPRRSELEVEPRREALRTAAAPGRGTRAAVVNERRVRGIVAVGLDSVAAGADVVVRVDVIDRHGVIEVPRQLLIELVPEGGRVHVRRVVADTVRVEVVLTTRVADRCTGVRPTERNTVRAARELVLDGRPLPVTLPLVLELHRVDELALHLFPQIGDGEPELEVVLAADFRRPFIRHVIQHAVGGRAGRCGYRILRYEGGVAGVGAGEPRVAARGARCRGGQRVAEVARPVHGPVDRVVRADAVAAAVDTAVQLVGCHQVQAAVLELQVAAVRIIEPAVIAVEEQVAAPGIVRS